MKKRSRFFSILLGLVASTVSLSCVVNGEKNEITAPTIRLVNNAVSVSFNSMVGMEYANIFRQKSIDSSFSTITETVNIGQVTPEIPGYLTNSFNFIDEYLTTTNYYRYYIRYYLNNYYAYTSYSASIQLQSESETGAGEAELTYINGETVATVTYYNNLLKKEYYLQLDTDVEVPHSSDVIDTTNLFTDLYYVISNGSVIKPYAFAEADTVSLPPTYQVSKGVKTNDLRIFLLQDFLGKTDYVTGLIAVKKTKNVTGTEYTPSYNSYYWTKLKEVQIFEKKIQKAEDEMDTPSKRDDNSIVVPAIENNTNDFDYNLSTKLVAPTDQFFMKSDDGTILDLTPFNP
ncbi:MAG: hypothetical protein IJS09_02225 [Treponema sp.]|nr:hypothetical protein [Treponema sp.]